MTKAKMVKLGVMLAIGLVVIGYRTKSRAADTKQDTRVWSDTYKGLALSVNPATPECKIGKQCEAVVSYKNLGAAPVELMQTGDFSDYRVVMFRADGTTLPKSETALKVESTTAKDRSGLPVLHLILIKLKPGEETQEILNFSRWFKIDKAGTYNLVVMRRFYSWDDGFIISNATPIKVVEMTDADETPIDKLRRHKVAPPTPPAPAPK